MINCLLLFVFMLFSVFAHAQHPEYSKSIVPEKEYYYLKNWKLQGDIKSIVITSHEQTNHVIRFSDLDQCRNNAKASDAFYSVKERYDFNRNGLLLKRTLFKPTGKEVSLYGYNVQGQITGIESGERMTVFHYDLHGKLIATEGKSGARTDLFRLIEYSGDTIFSVTHDLITGSQDSLVEVIDSVGNIVYTATETPTHDLREVFMSYDSISNLILLYNNTGLYQAFEYDEKRRPVKIYVGKDRSFMSSLDYKDETGIHTITRWELVDKEYVPRNHECCCRIIDGQNNPLKCEYIDCSTNGPVETYGLNGFYEVSYEYFKPSKLFELIPMK